MPTIWHNRFAIFVSLANQVEANARYASIDPDVGGAQTFNSLRLSPDGYEPATHVGTNTAATDAMMAKIKAQISLIPWSGLYDIVDGSTWDWDGAQMDNHLRVVRPWGDAFPTATPQLPPWVGKGTHVRCLVWSPMNQYQAGRADVADVIEQYLPDAFWDYGGTTTLHTVCVTLPIAKFDQIALNSYYQILWDEEV